MFENDQAATGLGYLVLTVAAAPAGALGVAPTRTFLAPPRRAGNGPGRTA